MPAQLHRRRVADRQPRDVLHRHGLLVIGQQAGRAPAGPAQRHVDRSGHRGPRFVQQRQDHPVPGPGQPQAEQRRLHLPDQRPVAEVVLRPHPRLGDVRPVHPPPPREVRPLDLGDRPPRGPLRPAIPHRGDRLVRHIGADLPLRPVDQLLQLGQERAGHPRPPRRPGRNRPAPLALGDIPCDGVMGAARQLGGVPQRPRQVVSLRNVHDLLGRFHSSPPRELAEFGWHRSANPGRGTPPGNRQGTVKIVSGRSPDRRRAVLMSASGQLNGHLRAVSRDRRHATFTSRVSTSRDSRPLAASRAVISSLRVERLPTMGKP